MAKVMNTFGVIYEYWVELIYSKQPSLSPYQRTQYHEQATLWKKEWQSKGLLPKDGDVVQKDNAGLIQPYYATQLQLLLKTYQTKVELLTSILQQKSQLQTELLKLQIDVAKQQNTQLEAEGESKKSENCVVHGTLQIQEPNPDTTPFSLQDHQQPKACYTCGKTGHLARTCRYGANGRGRGAPPQNWGTPQPYYQPHQNQPQRYWGPPKGGFQPRGQGGHILGPRCTEAVEVIDLTTGEILRRKAEASQVVDLMTCELMRRRTEALQVIDLTTEQDQ